MTVRPQESVAACPDDEAALAAALRLRAPGAWAELYDRHYRQIYRYLLARTSSPEASEDLAAEVFLEALQGIRAYSYRGRPVIAWLYRIARNLASDDAKRGRRFISFSSEPVLAKQPVTDGRGGDPAFAAAQLDLREAVAALTGEQQEVIILHYFVGLRLREVANVLGKTEAAVYSLQARAIHSLRRGLEDPE